MTAPSNSPPILEESRDGIEDARFVELVRDVSRDGTTWFTLGQLYARACALGLVASPVLGVLWAVAGLLTAAGFGLALLGALFAAPILAVVGAASVVASMALFMVGWLMPPPAPPEAAVRHWVDRWSAAGRPLARLLREPALEDGSPDAAQLLSEHAHPVQRLLIVQHDVLVDLIVRNGLHAPWHALVLSEGGYPSPWRAQAVAALLRSEPLPVLLLHDATDQGMSMRYRVLHEMGLPLSGETVRDLGISPRDALAIPELEPIAPRARGYRVALELIPWDDFASALDVAVREPMSVAEALAVQRAARKRSS